MYISIAYGSGMAFREQKVNQTTESASVAGRQLFF